MFLKTHQDLGIVKVDSKHTVYFPYENIPRIISIISPCDCASVGDERHNSRVVLNYKVKPIPAHLEAMGYSTYSIRKEIVVTHTTPDGLGEIKTFLVISGEVKK